MPSHNIRFLVIDRDESAQDRVQSEIGRLGYGRVIGVSDVREGLFAIGSGVIDFVICDWPEDPGPELGFVKLLKSQEMTRYIPVLMTVPSAAPSGDRARRATLAGADGVLAKPLESAGFQIAVDQILARTPSLR